MSAGWCRTLAMWLGTLLERVYPPAHGEWARAMQFEIDSVEGDGAALLFALGCLWGGCRLTFTAQLSEPGWGASDMIKDFGRLNQPRNVGIACAFGATALGLFYLAAAGAPPLYLVVNAAAFLLGMVALAGFAGAASRGHGVGGAAIALFGIALLATAVFGASADGATRWIRFGPLGVQLSLVILPAMMVAYARQPGLAGTFGIAAAAIALALQPDRAMSGVLAAGLTVLAVARPGRLTASVALVAAIAFVVTLARPDALPAVPFVDQILFTAFDVHPLAGAAVVLGSMLLLVPAVAGYLRDPANRPAYLAFGAAWLGCVLAAALANYPTPVVGYGGSAILGYLLSLAWLPAPAQAAAQERRAQAREEEDFAGGLHKAVSPALAR